MKVIYGIENYQQNDSLYLALGNFDGIHRGHKHLISTAVEKAKKNGGKSAAFIFEPHPAQVLFPEKAPKLLGNRESKTKLLEQCGLDLLIYHPFTMEIASWSPEKFVHNILINGLHIKEVFVGFNHSFGHRGAGTPEAMKQMGKELGFAVNVIDPVTIDGELVSSSLVRKLLEQGDVQHATKMLGYSPFIQGNVIHGEHRGSTIGFPTANIGIDSRYTVPAKGVYAGVVTIEGDVNRYKCVVNIGSKPTFHEIYPLSIEAHIVDYNQDIYGKTVTLTFMEKLRDEKKFASIEELLEQINNDKNTAIDLLEGVQTIRTGN
ncbi:MAG: bifunctional riboflavin kinase/FAD synthetase [Bacillota bacterium]|nr:bifunctional riboflavin kinase/FAD synthetase [Bacillota bacterium]